MPSYIDNALATGEKVIYQGHVSAWSVFGSLLIGGLLALLGLIMVVGTAIGGGGVGFGLFLLLPGAVILAAAYIKLKTTELAITSKRVIAKFGFISRTTVELNITKVESIQVEQGILGRMLNYGSLVISGGGNPQAPIPGISNPMAFRKAFSEATDKP